jgi:SAM-dependent methyltransferase
VSSPQKSPIQAAKPAIRSRIKCGIFDAKQFTAGSLDLIITFQVIEHVWDPVTIAGDAIALLKPGGVFFIVAHNRQAFSARVMGAKSPIFDIEHLQLFDKTTGVTLLRNVGFDLIKVHSVRNKYPVDYWIKLFPLPMILKSVIRNLADATRIGKLLLSLPAGNLGVVGRKPTVAV